MSEPTAPNLLIRPDEVEPFDRDNGVATIPYVGKWNCGHQVAAAAAQRHPGDQGRREGERQRGVR